MLIQGRLERSETILVLFKDRRYIHVTCDDEKNYIHVHAFHMGLERIFGDFDARPSTYLIHFKWTFDVDISTPLFKWGSV